MSKKIIFVILKSISCLEYARHIAVKPSGFENMRLISWDLDTMQQASLPFLHVGFTINNSGNALVAWGTLQELEDGNVVDLASGHLEFYSLANFENYDSIVILPEDDLKIEHVAWVDEDREVLVLAKMNQPHALNSLYRVNLQTGDQEVILTDLATSGYFSWNSAHQLIAFTNLRNLYIYDIGHNCYVATVQFQHSPFLPMWKDDSLFLTLIENKNTRSYQILELDLSSLAINSNSECLVTE